MQTVSAPLSIVLYVPGTVLNALNFFNSICLKHFALCRPGKSHLPMSWKSNPRLSDFLQLSNPLSMSSHSFLQPGPCSEASGLPIASSWGLRSRGTLVATGSEPVLSGGISGAPSCFRQDSCQIPTPPFSYVPGYQRHGAHTWRRWMTL